MDSSLLHHMRQFMGKQAPPLVGRRRKPARTQHDVMSHCVRVSVHIPRRLLGCRAGMHSHSRKAVAEARLHEGTCGGIERLARGAQHFLDDGWCCNLSRVAGLDALPLQALMFPARLLCLAFGAPSTAGTSALELRLWHAHHLFGDAVCFLLVNVSRTIYREF